jgi:hypothetical protein
MDLLKGKKVVVGSVAVGPYTNYGNRLIARATYDMLGLAEDTPSFSVFEPISEPLLEFINGHDYLVVMGCTTLQDGPGHQACFDANFARIKARKVCFGGAFYCEMDDTPPLRIAELYDTPIAARDPWSADYLTRNGFDCYLVGCPTLLAGGPRSTWRSRLDGTVVVSSTPVLGVDVSALAAGAPVRYVKHDASSAGEELKDFSIFDDASLVVTGRLHAALPAITRGIEVRFYDQSYWHADYQSYTPGSIRYTLCDYLGLARDGRPVAIYPAAQLSALHEAYRNWAAVVFR